MNFRILFSKRRKFAIQTDDMLGQVQPAARVVGIDFERSDFLARIDYIGIFDRFEVDRWVTALRPNPPYKN